MYIFENFFQIQTVFFVCYFHWIGAGESGSHTKYVDKGSKDHDSCNAERTSSTFCKENKTIRICDSKASDDKNFSLKFFKDIVDNKEKTFYKLYKKILRESSTNCFENSSFLNKEEIKNFYDGIKGRFDGNVFIEHEETTNSDDAEEFKRNKNYYTLKYLKSTALVCLNVFWDELKKEKITVKNYFERFNEIYRENIYNLTLDLQLNWLRHQLMSFLIHKHVSFCAGLLKRTTLEIIIDLCNALKVPEEYIPINNDDTMGKGTEVGDLGTNSEPCDNVQEIIIKGEDKVTPYDQRLSETISVKDLILCDFLFDRLFGLKISLKNIKLNCPFLCVQVDRHKDFFDLNLCFLLLVDTISGIFREVESMSKPYFIKNEFFVQSKLVCMTSRLIKFYRYFFLKFVFSNSFKVNDEENINNEDNVNEFEEPDTYVLLKAKDDFIFLVNAFVFIIIDSAFPINLRDLSLDRCSEGLDHFQFLYPMGLDGKNKKDFFISNYNTVIDLIIQTHVNRFKTFAGCSKLKLRTKKKKKSTVCFLLLLNTLHLELVYIYKFNMLIYELKHKNRYFRNLLQQKWKLYQREVKDTGRLYDPKPFYALYSNKKPFENQQKEIRFCEQVRAMRIFFCKLEPRKTEELIDLIQFISDFEFIDESDFKIFRFDFSDVKEFQIYHTSNHFFSRDLVDSAQKRLNTDKNEYERHSQKFLKPIEFVHLYYKKILYHQIEKEFEEIVSFLTVQQEVGPQSLENLPSTSKYTKKIHFGYFEIALALVYKYDFEEYGKYKPLNYMPRFQYIEKYTVSIPRFHLVINLHYSNKKEEHDPQTEPKQIETFSSSLFNDPAKDETIQLYVYQDENEVYFDKLVKYIAEIS